jgi:hypothetical protein
VDWENSDAASPSITLVGGAEGVLLFFAERPDTAAKLTINCCTLGF